MIITIMVMIITICIKRDTNINNHSPRCLDAAGHGGTRVEVGVLMAVGMKPQPFLESMGHGMILQNVYVPDQRVRKCTKRAKRDVILYLTLLERERERKRERERESK